MKYAIKYFLLSLPGKQCSKGVTLLVCVLQVSDFPCCMHFNIMSGNKQKLFNFNFSINNINNSCSREAYNIELMQKPSLSVTSHLITYAGMTTTSKKSHSRSNLRIAIDIWNFLYIQALD